MLVVYADCSASVGILGSVFTIIFLGEKNFKPPLNNSV